MDTDKEKLAKLRAENLKALLDSSMSRDDFCSLVECSIGHVGQMISGHRSMGEEVARRIERNYGLDVYWMDRAHNKSDPAPLPAPQSDKFSSDSILAARSLDALPEPIRHQARLFLKSLENSFKKSISSQPKKAKEGKKIILTEKSSTPKEGVRRKGV